MHESYFTQSELSAHLLPTQPVSAADASADGTIQRRQHWLQHWHRLSDGRYQRTAHVSIFLLHVSILSVRNFRVFLLMCPWSVTCRPKITPAAAVTRRSPHVTAAVTARRPAGCTAGRTVRWVVVGASGEWSTGQRAVQCARSDSMCCGGLAGLCEVFAYVCEYYPRA